MKTFISVAQLKLSILTAGQKVDTSGYFVPGDAGEANYLIAGAQAVDEFGSHTLANGNVALLQPDKAVANVKQYGGGAAGDVSANFLAADAATSESTYVPVDTYDLTAGDFTGLKYHSFGTPTISAGTITILNLNP